MACEEEFCKNYLLLKPENASLIDLVRIICSSELEERLVEFSEPSDLKGLRRRWLIFISVLAQKLFLCLRNPMAFMGHLLERWLNLLSNNGGFIHLSLNLLKGSVARMDESSAKFMSVVGNLDARVELDTSIHYSDGRYVPSLSVMAAKLSYENKAFIQTVVRDHWKMEFLGLFNFWNEYQKQPSTQAIMFRDTTSNPNLVVVAFRGTKPFEADHWRTDIDFSWYQLEGVGRIHRGFMRALGLQNTGWPKDLDPVSGKELAYYTLRQKLRELLHKNETAKLILTGHSLGGALAILFVAVLVLHEEEWLLERLHGVYTFGQPRVGDEQFGDFMEEKLRVHDVKYLRYVYSNDMVPRLPYDDTTLLYKHFGPCLYFNSCYQGKVVSEEPNKNYFSLLWAIPKVLNAVWELIRSFVIAYTRGKDYTEGWFLRLSRMFGLAAPGLVDHFPPNYVNVTRLGSLPSQLRVREPKHQQGCKHD